MELIRKFKKRRAIKSYIKKLPSMLKRDYRKSKRYTPKQVKSTIERGYLSVRVGAYFIKPNR
ncbi:MULTISPECIES: DUF6559 family protein [unclassified Photobacterium]|uniref:DUF6559 family protein n=1 Tax=unclassified Photobacterium TaxID=2628852 RepID=UPI003FA6F611